MIIKAAWHLLRLIYRWMRYCMLLVATIGLLYLAGFDSIGIEFIDVLTFLRSDPTRMGIALIAFLLVLVEGSLRQPAAAPNRSTHEQRR